MTKFEIVDRLRRAGFEDVLEREFDMGQEWGFAVTRYTPGGKRFRAALHFPPDVSVGVVDRDISRVVDSFEVYSREVG